MTVSWVMTYDSLILTTLQYLERSDPATKDAIPTFITLTEYELAQQIKTLGQIQVVQSTMIQNNPIIPKPARWRKTTSMSIALPSTDQNQINLTWQPLLLRKYEYLKEYAPSNISGIPKYYGDYDQNHYYVSPPPDSSYPFEILYYERIQPLSTENQTNYWTQNAPNAMLYGTLLQAVMFLKDDQRQIFQQKYAEAVQALKLEDESRVGDRSAIAIDS